MRITWKTLKQLIDRMTSDQLNSDVTVELLLDESGDTECFSAELRIANADHSCLDDYHPVIFVHQDEGEHCRCDDVSAISDIIGLSLSKGDKVKTVHMLRSSDTFSEIPLGTEGVILHKADNGIGFVVQFQNGASGVVLPSDVEHVNSEK